jgi:twitching motility protein PilT
VSRLNLLDELLQLVVDQGASDLHLSTNYHPCIRVHGEMQSLSKLSKTTAEAAEAMMKSIMPETNKQEFETLWDTDFGYTLPGAGRFRVNAFRDMNGMGGVFRYVPDQVPSLDDLQMGHSAVLQELCMLSKGLVLVTGPTGSGKSTTLAAMIDLINRTRKEHIITIEDPIEFIHQPKNCLINQREVHRHTRSFAGALRAALREDPDIVLVGELRDLETTEIALETAETGHLVFGTLHTNTATSAADRIIDKYPGDRQNQIRNLLANTLCGIIAQTLCKKIGGGRVAAAEILLATPAVRSNIREQKTHQLPTAIQTGYNLGMRSFTDTLFQLVQDGIIEPREAYVKAVDKQSLQQKFDAAGIKVDKSVSEVADGAADASADMNSPDVLKSRAWTLATSSITQARNGRKALEYIYRAIHLGADDPETQMILAAAQAETGDFKAAMDTVRKAIPLAKRGHKKDIAHNMEEHFNLYRKSKPLAGNVT